MAERGEQGTVQTPTERGAPRSLERPGTSAPGGGQSNPGSGGGGGGSGSGTTVPTVSDLPDLVSDVQNVLEPVTDNVQLPHLQAPQLPAPAPPIGLP